MVLVRVSFGVGGGGKLHGGKCPITVLDNKTLRSVYMQSHLRYTCLVLEQKTEKANLFKIICLLQEKFFRITFFQDRILAQVLYSKTYKTRHSFRKIHLQVFKGFTVITLKQLVQFLFE